METATYEGLDAIVRTGANAHVRNLAAAEAAVQRGQFNLAKVLRALAHSQRVEALAAARLLAEATAREEALRAALTELEDDAAAGLPEPVVAARKQTRGIARRALASLAGNSDVLESDVHQSLWGCYGCGYLAEGDRPDACPLCGALAPEFEWFGPFYAVTHEHLGQLTPAAISETLAAVPDEVEAALAGIPDERLRQKPSADEWCAKELVAHIFETDILFAERVRTILAGRGAPSVDSGVPPWKLHEGKGYEERSAQQLIERLRAVRAESLALVRGLSPRDWGRRGSLRGGAVTVLDLGTWLANHDRGHLVQLRRLTDGGSRQ